MSPALLFSLPISFLCMTQNNSTDHGPGRRSRWSTFATLHVRFQCNGRLCRRRASQESQFVNMIKNDGFEDGSLPLRNAGSQRSFEIPTVPNNGLESHCTPTRNFELLSFSAGAWCKTSSLTFPYGEKIFFMVNHNHLYFTSPLSNLLQKYFHK